MKKIATLLTVYLVTLLVASSAASAQDPTPPESEIPETSSVWEKFGFGVGLSFTIDTGHDDRVKSATLVDGKVRITDEENGIPRLVLEGHFFLVDKKHFGHGPFVAVQLGDDDLINAVALGYMMGFRRDENASRSWNIGVGFAADPDTQVLGDGLEPNQPLPGNETEVRFKEETQYGVMILFSTSW